MISLSTFKTRGVVLKTQDYKENDKLLWIYTEDFGKISAIAKGVKKRTSNLASSTLTFCFSDYILYKGRSLYIVNEGQLIHSFQEFMHDLETLTYCSYLNELVDIALVEEEKNFKIFKDLVTAYYLIKNKVGDIEVLIRTFEIKLLFNTGYALNLDRCTNCGEQLKMSNNISVENFGVTCTKCSRENSIKISNSTYNILRYIINLPLEKIHRLNVNKSGKKELYTLTKSFILEVYSRKPKSLEMFNYIIKE
ncbi:DNA repair protein RecO [Hathewaya histolytica]|uniref:DNA repair protein RecO n=1 Tax=Hathewaya histolytica TaxID=1498 RepID=UPI003B673BEA